MKENWRAGTPRYMSINNHKNLPLSSLDDVESLLYTTMYLANIKLPKLPAINLDVISFQKNKVFSEYKENLDITSIYGKEFNFFSQIYYYLKKIRKKNESIDFNILFELIELAESEENLSSFTYSE